MSDEQDAAHSVEPWEIEAQPMMTYIGSPAGTICDVWSKTNIEQDRANARRIVACVNALAGIPTEEIEAALSFDPCRGLLTVAIKDAVKARCAALGLDGFGQPIADRAKDK